MQGSSGLILIVAGACVAVSHLLPAPADGMAQLSEITRISVAPDRQTLPPDDLPRFVAAMAADSIISPAPADPIDPADLSGRTSKGWTAVVVADPSSPATQLKSSKAADAETRAELARDLQRELARVGCYGGEFNGAWTAATRRAMAAFMERVNATLPIDEPDYILLTLVQGQSAPICGVACPRGQSESSEGRCVPNAMMAQAARRADHAARKQRETSQGALDEPRRAARDDVRRVADLNRAVIERPATAAPSDKRKADAVALAIEKELPWLAEAGPFPTAPAAKTAPLPGRMSVGAPVEVATAPPTKFGAPLEAPARRVRTENPLDRVAALDTVDVATDLEEPPPVAEKKQKRARQAKKKSGRSANSKKAYAYAGAGYAYGGRVRRGLPRPGTMPFVMMQSMGGGGFY